MASNYCHPASEEQLQDSDTLPTKSSETCISSPCSQDSTKCTDENTSITINVAKLLSTRKSEQMFELRKLKLQQRPVSGFDGTQHLEKIIVSKNNSNSKQTTESTPVNSSVSSRAQELSNRDTNPNPQTLRPEGVQLEIRALFERRPVSQVLQSPMLDEMEHVLQEGLNRHQRRHRRRRPRPSNHHHASRGGGERSLLTAIRNSESRSRASGSRHRHQVPFQPPSDGHYPLPQRDQSTIVQQLRQSPALNSLGDEDRDRIVSEVSNLVQQQLVTSALSGEFRGVLELHIQERANHVSQGRSGEDFVQSLLTSRNERSPTHVQSASSSELHQEVQDMKSQLSELKRMLKASFDLQLDIQRSIKQEVAAALTAFLSPPGAQQATPCSATQASHTCPLPTLSDQTSSGSRGVTQQSQTQSGSEPQLRVVESGHCVICSEGIIDSVIYRCGHMCVCMSCGMELKAQGLKCPICRAPITDLIRAYASMC